MDAVNLDWAFHWMCLRCHRGTYGRFLVQSTGPVDDDPWDDAEEGEGEGESADVVLVMVPDTVQCRYCGAAYKTHFPQGMNGLGEDQDDE